MLFEHEGSGDSACARTGGASTTSCGTSSGPRRSRPDFGCESDNYLNELGQWSRGAEEDDEICRRSGTEPDYDYLEQWRTFIGDDHDDNY